MPLPKPPAKRAALLTPNDFESQAAPKPGKRTQKTSLSAEPASPAELNLYDAAAVEAAPPVVPAETRANTAVAHRPLPEARPRKPRGNGPAKLFVLDTNVLMHDPMSLFRFEEHDIYLPMITLEELDGHQRGTTEVARNARQASRSLDALAAAKGADIAAGLRLDTTGHPEARGCLFVQPE